MTEENEKVHAMTESQFREFMLGQLQAGAAQFTQIHEALAVNTEMTKANIDSTAELVEIFNGAKTGAAVFAWLGRNARKFVTSIYPFVLLAGAIAAIAHGKWPKWGE